MSFTTPIRVDLLDILAGVVGAVVGMGTVLNLEAAGGVVGQFLESDSDFADILIGTVVLTVLTAKRFFLPERPQLPSSNLVARNIYLLAAILGSLCLVGSVLWTWDLTRSDGLALVTAATQAAQPALAGFLLLAMALTVDKLFLRPGGDTPKPE